MPATQTRPEPVLVATDLVKDYETGGTVTRALAGVSLRVRKGRFVSVMGPSGSGKSTLLHLLGGLDAPTSGTVELDGAPLTGLTDRAATLSRRGRIGFVFQFFNLVPVLTVAENVALPMVIDARKPDSYAKQLGSTLESLGIAECANKLPSEISGGQQQRTAIGRALMGRPSVLLADEPTGNLDSKTGLDILRLIRRAQRRMGQTIVMVTHDANAAAYADEVILIRDGLIGGRLNVGASARDASNGSPGRKPTKIGVADRAHAVRTWLEELKA